MNDKAWKAFVDLSEKMHAETAQVTEEHIAYLERTIAQLEEENVYLRERLERLRNTSLLDLVP